MTMLTGASLNGRNCIRSTLGNLPNGQVEESEGDLESEGEWEGEHELEDDWQEETSQAGQEDELEEGGGRRRRRRRRRRQWSEGASAEV